MELNPWGESTFRAIRLGLSAFLGIGLGACCPWTTFGWYHLHGLSLSGAIVLALLLHISTNRAAYCARNIPGILCWVSLISGLASHQIPSSLKETRLLGLPIPSAHSKTAKSSYLGADLMLMQVYRQEGPTRFRAVLCKRLVYSTYDSDWIAYPYQKDVLLNLPFHHQSRDHLEKSFPKVGDFLLFETTYLRAIPGPLNPGQTDLRDYYQSQGLKFEINLRQEGTYRIIDKDKLLKTNTLCSDLSYKVKFGRWQSYWTHRMDLSISDSVGCALSKALLLGWRADLSNELQEGFRNSGTVHLLAVSGMHVLLIHQMLLWMMRGLYLIWVAVHRRSGQVRKPPNYLIFLVLSSLVMGYALLTGGAPSAMRAAMVLIWMNWNSILSGNRHASGALILIGIVLVWLEPNSWKDPGFQLSFGAVGGLLWIYAPMWKWTRLEQRSLWIRYPVSLVGMSLVAQVVTAPLCWFHFGQFPNYFLLANLVLVPLASPLLILAIGWTVVGSHSIVGSILAWVGKFLFGITAQCTAIIGSWPSAVTYHWDFKGSDLLITFSILGLLILGMSTGMAKRNSSERIMVFRQLTLFLSISWIFLLVNRNVRWFQERKDTVCIVFGLSAGNCLAVLDGRGLLWSGDMAGLTDRRPLQWKRKHTKLPDHPMASNDSGSTCRLMQWDEEITLIAAMRDTIKLVPLRGEPLRLLHLFGKRTYRLSRKVDFVVLGPQSWIQWSTNQAPSNLILAGGHHPWNRRKMASLCLQQGIGFYDLSPSNLSDSKVFSPYPPPKRIL